MLLCRRPAPVVTVASLLSSVLLAAQVPAPAAHPVVVPTAVSLSPDGHMLAWTLQGGSGVTATSLDTSAAAQREITVPQSTGCTYAAPAWSPDSKTLAFLASCAPPSSDPTVPRPTQIYLWSPATGSVRQLTHVRGDVNQPAWSPDGKSIGFLFVENATRTAGALDAMKPWAGVIGEDGVEVQRVSAVDVASGAARFLTPANLHVYEFHWAPDAQRIAMVAAKPPGENNWWVAKLYTAPVPPAAPGAGADRVDDAGLRTVLDPATVSGPLHGLQIAVPRWSPDGKQIAFIGGLMSDQGATGGDLYLVDARGGQPRDITPGIDGTPAYETWTSDHTIGFVEDRRGHTLLSAVDVRKGTLLSEAAVDLGEASVSGGGVKDAISVSDRIGAGSRDRVAVFAMQSFVRAPEIYSVEGTGAPRQLTHLNDDAKPTSRTESVEWTSGPFHVQGWLSFPANYDASRRYPIIVTVHGGPSSSVTARWRASKWAERGYFEFQPNPRGSFGQGEAFTQANRKDFGYGDLKDIEAGLDFVESKYPIDAKREGLTGWSYGGFMTMFGVTQTHRFRAAVAGAGLSDWLSYYGENSIDQWMLPFFGATVYDDPAVYAKSSAITYIRNVKTPTLVIVGDRDGECPAPQSFEFWHALRDLGVKTQLVVYPDEGHGFRSPDHIRDRDERTARWFSENMPENSAPTATAASPSAAPPHAER